MIRNLKTLGLALVAVFAFSATAASTASAVTDHFTTSEESVLMTGIGDNHRFVILGNTTEVGNSFECTKAKFTATALNNSAEATVDPEYTGTVNETPHEVVHCTSSAGKVTIDMNGCHYKLTGETTGLDENKADATVWIECPENQKIKITSALGPVISVPPQTPTKGGVVYTNKEEGGKKVVEVHATATGITYTCSTAFLCGLGGIATHCNDANYTGTVTMTGYKDVNGLPTPIEEGEQVNIEVS